MRLAIIIAAVADAIQLASGPAGWLGTVQVVDVITMLATMALLGFHILLLPTFVLEFIPGLSMPPVWTACVIAVITLRRKKEGDPPNVAVPPKLPTAPPQLNDESK